MATSAWVGERLEYRFGASGVVDGKEVVLDAPEYTGGTLDWSAFDIDARSDVSLMASGLDADSTPVTKTAMPAGAGYRGMPPARFWELEDADISFGAIDAGREDLTRLLLTDFALLYGNDFFVLPLELEIGSLCRIHALEVTDTFGARWEIPSIEDVDGSASSEGAAPNAFHLFRLTADSDPHGIFLLAPTLASRLTGPTLEEVAMVRDDTAATAWGVERIVVGPGGRPIRRRESEAELRERQRATQREEGTANPKQTTDPLVYRLAELPPGYWIPLVPAKDGNAIVLQVRALLDEQAPPQPIKPLGRILNNQALLRDEEVPRTGISVMRAYRQARWRGGSSLLWLGRARRLSQDEGPSGLRYDVAE